MENVSQSSDMHLKEEVKIYFEKLQKGGIKQECIDALKEKYGKAINKATYAQKTERGLAGDGILVNIVMRKLTVYALNINKLYPENMRVDPTSIIKICLLQHISKAIMFRDNPEEWRRKKNGELYAFAEKLPCLGVGLYSLTMAVECGITFTPIEVEAMTCIDKSHDDTQLQYHMSMLTSIIRQANEMVYIEYGKYYGVID